MKESWFKLVLSAAVAAAFTLLSTTHAADGQNYTQFSGPGMDYTSWNGALLVGPGHSLWGVRIGYLDGTRLVTGRDIEKDVARSGAYSSERLYADLDLTHYTVRWAKLDESTMLAEVTPKSDLKIVAEVYPAHHNTGNQDIPWPIKNPAEMTVGSDGIITGSSRHIDTVAGHTRITGGNAMFENRTVSIAPASRGLDHFRMETFPGSAETLNSEACKKRGYSRDGRNRAVVILDATKGRKIYLAASVASKALQPLGLSESKIKEKIDARQEKYLAKRMHGTGNFGLCAEPMINEILWNSTYNPFEKKVFVPAGRPWMGDGRYNLWGWDESLCAAVVSLASDEIAEINAILANADDRLGPYAGWYVYSKHGNIDVLKKNYPVYKGMFPPANGDLVKCGNDWNAEVGRGMDDTPMREHERKLGVMYSLDMTSMKAWSLELLAKMAQVLGKDEEAKQYRASYKSLAKKMNETFWNEEAGIYRNRYVSGKWPVTESPTSFYPWLAGVVDPQRSERLLASLLDESKFWGKYVIPSLAMDDPQYGKEAIEKHNDRLFPPFCYWRGNIWPPSNYLVYESLKRAGHDKAAAEYARKSVKMWHDNWLVTGGFPENYNPVTGKRSKMAHKHQTWSTLFTMVGVKELIDVEIWSNPDALRFGTMSKGDNSIYNYQHRGHSYDLEITAGGMMIKRDKKLLLTTSSDQCVIREFICVDGKVSCTIDSVAEQELKFYVPGNDKPTNVKVPAGKSSVAI